MVEKWLAGLLGEGIISSLDYARQFTVVLQGVFGSILSTVMIPMLTQNYAKNDNGGFNKVLGEHLVVCFTILALAVPLLYGAAQPLCEFFFLRGNVSSETLQVIVVLTRMYAVAFVGIILYLLFGNALLASNKGKLYALCGVLAQILVIAINILFIHYYGIYIFPISVGVSHLISAIIMSRFLKNGNLKSILFKNTEIQFDYYLINYRPICFQSDSSCQFHTTFSVCGKWSTLNSSIYHCCKRFRS